MRIIEPRRLSHGPFWLGLMVEALAANWDLHLTCPEAPEYAKLAAQLSPRFPGVSWHWHAGILESESALGAVLESGRYDHTLISLLDTAHQGIWEAMCRKARSPLSGIWFLPPRLPSPRSWRSLDGLRHLAWIRARTRVLKELASCLTHLMVLDESLRAHLSSTDNPLQVHTLPDPWPTQCRLSRRESRRRLDLPCNKRLYVHLGDGHPRKGLLDATQAWHRLERRHAGHNAVLVRAGRTSREYKQSMRSLVQSGQAILRDAWVADEDMDLYLRAADWVLLPYRSHAGSSGLLAGAAMAGRPVISSEFGVLGRRVQEAGLGLTFRDQSVASLAQAIVRSWPLDATSFRQRLVSYQRQHRPGVWRETFAAIFSSGNP